jgi:F-box protein 11
MAFMSYVRFDDEHDNGRLTQFRQHLGDEVRVQTGEDFPIFQDRNDIEWGQNWKERIEESLDEVTFLIPIITPSFFKSAACRDELTKFLKREKQLKRNDLVLPAYYVDCPLLNEEEERAADDLASAVYAHQYADWRELRFEPLTSPEVGRTLARLAVQIRKALGRTEPPAKAKDEPATGRRAASRRAREPSVSRPEAEFADESAEPGRGLVAKTEPPTLVVDPMHRGQHATISAAIAAANPGDRILVRPGLYEEGLVIDKPLEIIGDGNLGEIVVQATGQNAVWFKTTMGRIANVTLRQTGGGHWYCVNVSQGRLQLEDCDVTSRGLACVAIRGTADPRLHRNRIHDGKGTGVFVEDGGQGVLEENDIFGNALAGVEIKEGGNSALRRNRIHHGRASGVFVKESGQGILEDNDIFGNALAGLAIKTGGNPIVGHNQIHHNNQSGVHVYEDGRGRLEGNDIYRNGYSGVSAKEGGNPVVRGNRITRNGFEGVWIREGGAGTFEDNDLRDNAEGAWDVSEDSDANVKRARNLEE